MNTHRSDFTTEELAQWLPKFQAELVEDFHTSDGTCRPSVYQFHYDNYVIGLEEDFAEKQIIIDDDGQTHDLQDFLNDLWNDDPDEILQAIESDRFTGIRVKDGQAIVGDEYDFAEWVKTNQKHVSVYGAALYHAVQPDHLHFTRKAAERDLRENPWRHPEGAQILSDYFRRSPDLQRLLELVYALDLEKSTLVFKES